MLKDLNRITFIRKQYIPVSLLVECVYHRRLSDCGGNIGYDVA
jgi:hypothetical protein